MAVPANEKETVCGYGFGLGLETVMVAELHPSIANGFAAGMLLVETTELIVAASDTKLPASKNTPESNI